MIVCVVRLNVVVDATETKEDPMLVGPNWVRLLGLSKTGALRLHMSVVVLRETARHHARAVEEYGRHLREGLERAHGRMNSLKALGVDVTPSISALRIPAPADHLPQLLAHLDHHEAIVMPMPNMTTEELLDRDLDLRRPFLASGKGFRDALIWGSVVELVNRSGSDEDFVLVTENSSDFCDKDGSLHPDLQADLKEGAQVVVLPKLSRLFSDSRYTHFVTSIGAAEGTTQESVPDPVGGIDQIVLAALEAAVGPAGSLGVTVTTPHPYDSSTLDLRDFGLPEEIETPAVIEVTLEPGSLSLDLDETFEGGTQIYSGTCAAEMIISGAAHKGEFHVADHPDVDIYDFDLNNHFMEVYANLDGVLSFEAQVEAGGTVSSFSLRGFSRSD